MKRTGIVRKIDKVGRVVIPKELRWRYKLEFGDLVEIFTDENSICLKKYEKNIKEEVDGLYKTVERMEQEIRDTKELEEYLQRVRCKLEQLQKE